jgi:hypothetical protein
MVTKVSYRKHFQKYNIFPHARNKFLLSVSFTAGNRKMLQIKTFTVST